MCVFVQQFNMNRRISGEYLKCQFYHVRKDVCNLLIYVILKSDRMEANAHNCEFGFNEHNNKVR